MQSIWNRIFVELESQYNDKIVTDSGVEFFLNTSFNPEEHATIRGRVVSAPLKYDIKYHKEHDPAFNHDYATDVKEGDILFFNYLVTAEDRDNNENYLEYTVENEDGTVEVKSVWSVDHWQAIAIERDGKVKPFGQYILLEPIEEEVLTSSLIEIPDHIANKVQLKAKVYASNDEAMPEGAIVISEEVGQFKNTLRINGENKVLFCALNKNILAKYEEEAPEAV
jgi:co-chaperonin GroES (HSP10)